MVVAFLLLFVVDRGAATVLLPQRNVDWWVGDKSDTIAGHRLVPSTRRHNSGTSRAAGGRLAG